MRELEEAMRESERRGKSEGEEHARPENSEKPMEDDT